MVVVIKDIQEGEKPELSKMTQIFSQHGYQIEFHMDIKLSAVWMSN